MPGATRTSSDSCHPCAINRYCTTSSYAQSTTDGVTQVQSECVDEETTYADFCFPFAANGLSSEAHIIGLEYNLDPSNVDVLHHFVLYGHYSSDCSDNGAANAGEHLGEWAPGVMDRVMPADVGVRIGGSSGYKSIALNGQIHACPVTAHCMPQIGFLHFREANRVIPCLTSCVRARCSPSFAPTVHYDNPMHRSFVDHSGVLMWATSTMRTHDMGVLALGDPRVQLRGLGTIPSGISRYDFDCASSRLSALPHALNVAYIQLHMHQSGIAMETVQYDRNGVYKATHRTDYYDFEYQSALQGSEANYVTGTPTFTIEPGDRLHTTCWFNNDGRAGDISTHAFGLSSSDEMCIAFFAYW